MSHLHGRLPEIVATGVVVAIKVGEITATDFKPDSMAGQKAISGGTELQSQLHRFVRL